MPTPEQKNVSVADKPVSRMKTMQADGINPPLPDLPAPAIIEHLMDIGPTIAGPMGSMPIGWQDLAAWHGETGIRLPPWQLRLLRRLSAEYLNEASDATKVDRPAPWTPEAAADATKEAIADKVERMLEARMRGIE